MPKLSKDKAKKVDEVEPTSFDAIPDGIYLAVLADVESKEGPAGEYWSWRFEQLENFETQESVPGSQWANTSLSDSAEWKLKEVFDAFGVPTTTDTDKLLGQPARLVVSTRVIEKGARMGELGNQVDRVLPAEEEDKE